MAATWLTLALVSIESPEQRAITIVNAGGSRRALMATTSAALTGCVVLTAVGLLLPLAVGTHTVTATELLLGVGAQLGCGCVGVGIGLLCSRLVIGRPGYSLLAAVALVLAMLLVRALPPVNPLLRLLSSGRPPADLVGPVAGLGLVAVALLTVSAAATQLIATRNS